MTYNKITFDIIENLALNEEEIDEIVNEVLFSKSPGLHLSKSWKMELNFLLAVTTYIIALFKEHIGMIFRNITTFPIATSYFLSWKRDCPFMIKSAFH